MSRATWMAEFYPVPAQDKRACGDDMAALTHSLTKWQGLRSDNLAKHGGVLSSRTVEFPDGYFWVNDDSCALCVRHVNGGEEYHDCERCPLYKEHDRKCDGGNRSPFAVFQHKGDPEPMITLIGEAIASAGERASGEAKAKVIPVNFLKKEKKDAT